MKAATTKKEKKTHNINDNYERTKDEKQLVSVFIETRNFNETNIQEKTIAKRTFLRQIAQTKKNNQLNQSEQINSKSMVFFGREILVCAQITEEYGALCNSTSQIYMNCI